MYSNNIRRVLLPCLYSKGIRVIFTIYFSVRSSAALTEQRLMTAEMVMMRQYPGERRIDLDLMRRNPW